MKNILCLLLIVVLFACQKDTKITEYVRINDAIFEKILVAKGIDTDRQVNRKISKIDALKVDSLEIQGDLSNIENTIHLLDGIEEFENLTYLDCSYNFLNELNLSQNHKLKFLKCAGIQEFISGVSDYKQIQIIRLSTSRQLRFLNCSYTNLSNLNFLIDQTNLEVLDCTGSNISSFNISALTNLTELYASWILYNKQESIDLRQNTKLQKCKLLIYGLKSICVASLDTIPSIGWEKLPTTSYINCQ